MAHQIDQSKGFSAFVSFRAPGWHGLGKTFDTAIDAKTAFEQSGANFEVIKAPNVHRFAGLEIISDASFFTYRSDVNKVLGDKLGAGYTVLQNIELFNLVNDILGAGTASIETAGVLDEGRRVFICLQVNKDINVAGNDKVKQYVLIANSHDGSLSITAMPTNVRVVCANTLAAALQGARVKDSGAIRLRHTINAKDRLQEAAKVLKLINENTQVNADIYGKMKETEISKLDLVNYLGNIVCSSDEIKALQAGKLNFNQLSTRKRNIFNSLVTATNNGIGQKEALSSNGNLNMWYAYNGVTTWLNDKKYKSANDRATDFMFGSTAALIQSAGLLAVSPEKIKPLQRSATSDLSLN